MNKSVIVADENIALSTVPAPRKAGYQVVSVAEESPSASDEQVLRRACELNARILTFDRDYGDLIFRRGCPAPRAVLYLRFAPRSPDELTAVVLKLFDESQSGALDGYLVVWARDGIRKRAFPAKT